MRIVVVLPAPLGPMNPNRSPRFRFKLIDLMAYSSPYFFVKSRVSIIDKSSSFFSVGRQAEFYLPLRRSTKTHAKALSRKVEVSYLLESTRVFLNRSKQRKRSRTTLCSLCYLLFKTNWFSILFFASLRLCV